jgi:replicative DNA helicase
MPKRKKVLPELQFHIAAEQAARNRKTYVFANDAMKHEYGLIIEHLENPMQLTGLSTGYPELDEFTQGLQNKTLIVLAARPGMGKHKLSLCIAQYVATSLDKTVGLFSLKMSTNQVAQQLIAIQSGVHAYSLRRNNLDSEELTKLTDAIRRLPSSKLIIDDSTMLTPHQLAFKARRLKREYDLKLIVIDSLQLMLADMDSNGNRAAEIAEILRSLKYLALELDTPIIILSQINRSLENRIDKRPSIPDLRYSQSIEPYADIILTIYRDEYYNKENSNDKNMAEVIINKNRHGPTGSFKLKFGPEYQRFESLTHCKLSSKDSQQVITTQI